MPMEKTTEYTKALCSYIKRTNYEDIPPAVLERAKMMVMQTIGSALASRPLKQCEDVLAMAREMSGGSQTGGATLWGDGTKVSAEAALLAAGAMSDMLDWEDCALTGHPSSGVIPTAVVMSEVLNKSGKELLTAVVIGYEVYMRIALSGRSNLVAFNIFGCLPVLMKLLDMSEEEMNRCFGIGAACAIIPCNVHE
ncbi:MAG: MmgE/PrpD family protein, partial [Lachnospiraceae bacterium]|nr:MmgE/PrpD family protein [Lachnospiraceae bacterium]